MAHKTPQPGMFQGAIEFQRRFKCPDAIEGPLHQCREVRGWKPQESYMRNDSDLTSSRTSEVSSESQKSLSPSSSLDNSESSGLSEPRDRCLAN